jgi:hypothetical protein
MQLVWISVASNALIALCLGIFFMLSLRLPQDVRIPFLQKLPWLILLLLGVIGDVLAESALRKGIAAERWPESLLLAPRKLLEQPVFSVLGWSLIVASFAVLVFSRGQHIAGYWFFLAPQMGLSRVRMSLRPQNKAAANSGLLYPAKPLQSEQWGTPPSPFTN